MIRSTLGKRRIASAACCAFVVAACAVLAHSQQFALRDGDTVVFYGDSITAQRLYTKYVEEFVLTRYPALHIRFINAGVPGDTAYGGYAGAMEERVQRDVASFHPAMITVMLGMNDGGWGLGSPQIDAAFQNGYHALLDALHKADPGAAITLICPTPYDEITHGTEFPGYSHVIAVNADDVSRIGAQLQASGDKSVALADFHRTLTDALVRANTQFPQMAPLIIPDRIHPAETGHWIMAATLMSAWHVNPVVSRLALNAANAEVIDKDRTAVTDLVKSTDGLQWTQRDDALPLPLDFNNAMIPVLLGVSDIAQLDQMTLRVETLDPGQYELSIDTKPIASFTREDLQHGVNLALLKTPMLDQARGVEWNEDRRATLDQARFVLSAELKENSTTAIAEAALQKAQDELAEAIRAKLTPRPHRFELRRQ